MEVSNTNRCVKKDLERHVSMKTFSSVVYLSTISKPLAGENFNFKMVMNPNPEFWWNIWNSIFKCWNAPEICLSLPLHEHILFNTKL